MTWYEGIKAFVDECAARRIYGEFGKVDAKNLLLQNPKKESALLKNRQGFRPLYQAYAEGKDQAFLALPIGNRQADREMAQAMEEMLLAYTKNKAHLLALYRALISFVCERCDAAFHPDLPEHLPSNSMETQIELVKMLHQPVTKAQIQQNLCLSERAISDYLQELKNEDNGLKVQNQMVKLEISEEPSPDGKLFFTEDRAHPIFLVLQTQSVLELLEALRQYSERYKGSCGAVEQLAADIWDQLSPYGKEIVLQRAEEIGSAPQWYEKLDGEDCRPSREFQSRRAYIENHYRYGTTPDLLYAFKAGRTVQITAADGKMYMGRIQQYRRVDDGETELLFVTESGEHLRFLETDLIDCVWEFDFTEE
jgi:hypothetical protein